MRAPLPANVPVVSFDRVDVTTPQSAGYFWYGWSPPETQFRWTEAKETGLTFRVNGIRDLVLTLKVQAFVSNQHPEQRLNLSFNRKPVASFSFNDTSTHEINVVLPSSVMRQQNLLEFFLPDAVAPASLGIGDDNRTLGVALYWIQFSPKAIGHISPARRATIVRSSIQAATKSSSRRSNTASATRLS